jgi:hypothetical protein
MRASPIQDYRAKTATAAEVNSVRGWRGRSAAPPNPIPGGGVDS